MRRIVAAILLLAVCALAGPVQAQNRSTRPRRVGNGNATPAPVSVPAPQPRVVTEDNATDEPARDPNRRPPTLGGTDNSGTATRRPPTLGGTSAPNSTPAARTSVPDSNGPVEVGDDEIVRVNTTLVTVPVSVLDRSGKYIPNLRQRDFQLTEDNAPQEIAYFSAVEAPFTVALVIDTSGSTESRIHEIQGAAIAFVNQLRPADRVMVVSFDDRINVLCEPTNDRYTLRSAIQRTTTGEGTKLYDALDYIMNVQFHRIQGRKAIVLFTDGVDTTSKRANYESTMQDAEELDALIYPVQYNTYAAQQSGNSGGMGWPGSRRSGGGSTIGKILGGILGGGNISIGGGGGSGSTTGSSRADYQRADAYLSDLADKTGARKYRAESLGDVNQAFALVAEELRRQYSIGYYPKDSGASGTRRRIKVRVNRPDLVVRARDSYIYTGGGSQNASQPNQPPQIRKTPLTVQTY